LWLQSYVASVDIIQNDKLGGPWYAVTSVRVKILLTQRAGLEGEDQLRWVSGFSLHASLLLPCDSLVRVLRAILLAVCVWDGVFVSGQSFGFNLMNCFVIEVMISHVQTAFGSGRAR